MKKGIIFALCFSAAAALAGGNSLDTAKNLYMQSDFTGAAKVASSLGTSQGLAYAARVLNIGAWAATDTTIQESMYTEAEKYARQAQRLDDKNPDAYFEIARSVGRLGEIRGFATAILEGTGNEVKRNLDKTLELQPKRGEGWAALGVWNAEVASYGGFAAAVMGADENNVEPYLQKAIALEPDCIGHRVAFARALMLLDKSNKSRAIEQLRIALKLKPQEPEDKIQLGFARDALAKLQ